jgi:hypothetical protein
MLKILRVRKLTELSWSRTTTERSSKRATQLAGFIKFGGLPNYVRIELVSFSTLALFVGLLYPIYEFQLKTIEFFSVG